MTRGNRHATGTGRLAGCGVLILAGSGLWAWAQRPSEDSIEGMLAQDWQSSVVASHNRISDRPVQVFSDLTAAERMAAGAARKRELHALVDEYTQDARVVQVLRFGAGGCWLVGLLGLSLTALRSTRLPNLNIGNTPARRGWPSPDTGPIDKAVIPGPWGTSSQSAPVIGSESGTSMTNRTVSDTVEILAPGS